MEKSKATKRSACSNDLNKGAREGRAEMTSGPRPEGHEGEMHAEIYGGDLLRQRGKYVQRP